MTTMAGSTCRPRFATPRDERFPTLGPQVGEFSKRMGAPFMPWQQAQADVAYELDPATGVFRYDEIDGTVPRQSGKTRFVLAKKAHRLVKLSREYGPQRATYVAQTRLAARKKLERDFAEALRSSRSFSEVPHARARPTKATEWRLSLNNGSEAIEFGHGNFLQIDAPSRTGGHGDTLDDGTIDEAFAHEDDTVEAAMRPAMATRRNAQLWVISTAGDVRSKYLWRKILAGRAACESGEHGRVAYFEYSAPDDADPGDPLTWWSCMPALGITIPEEFIQGEWERAQRKGQAGVDMFRRAYLNQWPEVPILDDEATYKVIAGEMWAACEDMQHRPTGRLRYALDVDTNTKGEEWCSIGCSDGIHIEDVTPIDTKPGTGWVVEAVKTRQDTVGELLIDPGGPARKLIAPLEQAGITLKKMTANEVSQASMQVVELVRDGMVRHIGQPRLTRAVAGVARRDVGDGAFRFSRSYSADDISTLNAVSFARFAAAQAPNYDVLDSVL